METWETTEPLRWTKWWALPPHSGMSLKEKGGACHPDHCHTNYLVLELKQWCDYLPPCHHQISEFECLYCSSLLGSLNQAMAWRLTISSLDTLVEVPTSATFPLGNLVRVEIYLAGMSVHLKQWIFLAHFPLFPYSFNLYVFPLSPSFLGSVRFCSIQPCPSEEHFVLSFGMSDGPWEGSGRGQIGVET